MLSDRARDWLVMALLTIFLSAILIGCGLEFGRLWLQAFRNVATAKRIEINLPH